MHRLESVKWHDLPVQSISIGNGELRLVVTPFKESIRAYQALELILGSLEGLSLELSGKLAANDLRNIEVATFDFTHVGAGAISGSLGLLPGDSGYWSIKFERANWKLVSTECSSEVSNSTAPKTNVHGKDSNG